MGNKKQFFSVSDFLNNDKFITWRLLRTEELDVYWSDFLKDNPDSKLFFDEACRRFNLIKLNDRDLQTGKEEELFKKIYSNIQRRRKIRHLIYWTSTAASFFILLSIILFNYYNKEKIVVAQTEIIGLTLPEKNVKLFSGEDVISIESNSVITLSEKGEASVTDKTSDVKKIALTEDKINKLVVPYGQRSSITLADGSIVWLNSGTVLEFPSNFSGDTREIKVNGEIFLDVKKSDKPFIVHTFTSRIDVLGTQFNVTAYSDESEELIVLVEGCLQVSVGNEHVVIVAPNEMVSVMADEITKTSVDVSEYICWRNGLMMFNRTPMKEVLKRVERYYNLSFEMSDNISISGKTVSGKLLLFDNIDSVMTAFSVLSSTEYKRDNENIIFREKE